jgi:hypothetical protein
LISLLKKWAQINSRNKHEIDDSRLIHFLHIGKNAGNEISRWMRKANDNQSDVHFRLEGHHTKLRDLSHQVDWFFSIRHPVDRFVSAFYSRKRCGRPLYNTAWTNHENLAFEAFPHASELADNLFQTGEAGEKAVEAITAISHTSMHQIDWFAGQGAFLKLTPPPLP